MPPLPADQLSQIKDLLASRRRTLLEEVRESLENTQNQQYVDIIGRAPADAGDASVSDELADLNLTMLDRHVSELRSVEQAEQRAGEAHYGECSDCGQDIGFERLMAQPTAVRCVRCQDQYEKTHATQSTPTM
ncbi:MAG: TraR/DksA family transcriptional regulator [Pseudomonadota bacterium]|nr:TraR/DksA family transcriptional regulator [Pseudomonadota bacterium]